MTLRRAGRKLALTAHITASVGWFGGVVTFLLLAVTAAVSDDVGAVRAALLVMEPVTWWVLLPLAVASLTTGLVSALGTRWGLLRHYWVLFKLVLNVVATAVLATYTRTIETIAERARDQAVSAGELRALALSPVIHATLALLVLLAATGLAVYKPRGETGLRRREPHRRRAAPVAAG